MQPQVSPSLISRLKVLDKTANQAEAMLRASRNHTEKLLGEVRQLDKEIDEQDKHNEDIFMLIAIALRGEGEE